MLRKFLRKNLQEENPQFSSEDTTSFFTLFVEDNQVAVLYKARPEDA
jgi:hypothetical protein